MNYKIFTTLTDGRVYKVECITYSIRRYDNFIKISFFDSDGNKIREMLIIEGNFSSIDIILND